MGEPSDQLHVVQPPVVRRGPGTPLLIASTPSGTVISSLKVALSDGWSFTGNQVLADSGWPSAMAPCAFSSQPPWPSTALPSWAGWPPYSTTTVNGRPLTMPRAGLTTSSVPSAFDDAR